MGLILAIAAGIVLGFFVLAYLDEIGAAIGGCLVGLFVLGLLFLLLTLAGVAFGFLGPFGPWLWRVIVVATRIAVVALWVVLFVAALRHTVRMFRLGPGSPAGDLATGAFVLGFLAVPAVSYDIEVYVGLPIPPVYSFLFTLPVTVS